MEAPEFLRHCRNSLFSCATPYDCEHTVFANSRRRGGTPVDTKLDKNAIALNK